MPQPYEFAPLHADGIRHADLDAGVRVLNELIYECQRSLEGIEHARLDLDAPGWARGGGSTSCTTTYGEAWASWDEP